MSPSALNRARLQQLPAHIAQRLGQLMRRARGVALAKGLGFTLGTLIVGMLAAEGVGLVVAAWRPDLLTVTLRLALTAIVLAATAIVAVTRLVRPMQQRYTLSAAAMALEKDHPELQERISTTVELLLSNDPESIRGSRQMIQAVADAADTDSTHVSARQVVRAGRAERIVFAAVVLAAAAVALAINWPDQLRQLWDNSVHWTQVDSLSGDIRVVRMDPVTLEAKAYCKLRQVDSAILVIRYGDGSPDENVAVRAANSPDHNAVFRYTVSQVSKPFSYTFKVHDGESDQRRVSVTERPELRRLDLTCEYPKYTGLPDRVDSGSTGRITALNHSRVTMVLTTNQPLAPGRNFMIFTPASGRAATRPDEVSLKLPLEPISAVQYKVSMEVLVDGRYRFEMYGNGLSGVADSTEQAVKVEQDAPPKVVIEKPAVGEKVALRPDDKLPIGYEASDQFGLSGLRIRYSLNKGPWKEVPATLPDNAGKFVRATTVFDLKPLHLDPVPGNIECVLEAADNLPAEYGGPQWGSSAIVSIELTPNQADYAARAEAKLREAFAARLEMLIRELKLAQSDVRNVQTAMVATPAMDAVQETSTTSAVGHLGRADKLGEQIVTASAFTNYEKLAARIQEVIESHVRPANQLAAGTRELRDAEQADQRKDKLKQADYQIQRALDLLTAIAQEFRDLMKLEMDAALLDKMRQREEELAAKLAQDIRDPRELAKMTAEQMDLLNKMKDLEKQDRDKMEAPLADIAKEEAKTLDKKIDEIAKAEKKLADDTAKKPDELAKDQAGDLKQKQHDVAEAAAKLADKVAKQPADAQGSPQPPKPDAAADMAAAETRAAADKMDKNDLPAAADEGAKAEKKLGDLAAELAKKADDQAGVDPQQQKQKADQAAEAGKLADEQKDINKEMANLAKQDPQANLPLEQEAIRQQTKEAGEEAQMVADMMKQMSPEAGQKAQAAADQLNKKTQADEAQAEQAMKAGQPEQAEKAEKTAAEDAEKAKEMFDEAAKQAVADAEKAEHHEEGEKSAEHEKGEHEKGEHEHGEHGEHAEEHDPHSEMAKAHQAEEEAAAGMKDAAQAQSAEQSLQQMLQQARAAAEAAEAAQHLGQASKEMSEMAEHMGQPEKSNHPSNHNSPPWFSMHGSKEKAPDLTKLNKELGLTSSEWNRLPGYLQQAIVQSADEKVPQEYRELIKRYFQTISQEAGQE